MRININNRTIADLHDWQRDCSKLDTQQIQYWKNGIMVTAMLSLADAQKMVKSGMAYVITGQAIGCILPDGTLSS